MSKKAKAELVQEKERAFLLAFYGKGSATRLDRRASALAAGYTPERAVWNANRLLLKFADKGFRECVETIGVSTPALAVAFKETLEAAEGKDALAALRLALANRGEQTDAASVQKNVINQPVMVMIGATPERIRALRNGGTVPELPPAPSDDQQRRPGQ